jgi:glucose/mannose-6-phosphate isomerase
MKNLIQQFPEQLGMALKIGKGAKLTFRNLKFNQVCIMGLGGSGIGATIVQDYMFDKSTIPVVVNKHYFIPKSVNNETLFIASSYSGNTEETIEAVKQAIQRKAQIVCISSGGELVQIAKKHKLNLIEIPAGSQPRACLGYSLIQLLFVLKATKILKENIESEILASIQLIKKETKLIQKSALKIANNLVDKQVAIYAIAGHEGLAIRFRQQLNENSKLLAWHNVIPEMTHNEIVGWRNENASVATLFCYQADDFERNIKRLQILKKVVKKYNKNVTDVITKGTSYWEKVFYFIHLTDWISVFVSDANGQNPDEVKVIDQLKSSMSKK